MSRLTTTKVNAAKLYDEDGIDGPFDKAMKRAMRDDGRQAAIPTSGRGNRLTDIGPGFARVLRPDGGRLAGRVQALVPGAWRVNDAGGNPQPGGPHRKRRGAVAALIEADQSAERVDEAGEVARG